MNDQEKARQPEEPNYQGLTFYSDNEGRIKRAKNEVKWLVSLQNQKKPSFLKSFFSSRSSVILFISILVIAGFIWIFNKVEIQDTVKIDGMELTASAFYFDDAVYLTVNKNTPGININRGSLSFNIVLDSGQNLTSEILLTEEKNQTWYFVIKPADKSKSATITVRSEQKKVEFDVKIDGKSP